MEQHLATVWESIADLAGNRAVIVQGDVRRSWSEFDDRASRIATALTAAGLRVGSKVALYLRNCPEYLEVVFAALKMRGVPVNVNFRYTAEELRYLLDNSDAEAIVFHESLASHVYAVRDQLPDLKLLVVVEEPGARSPSAEDVIRYSEVIELNEPMERISRSGDDLFMLYTGGTTGRPKGVMYRIGSLTTRYITSSLSNFYQDLGYGPEEHLLAIERAIREDLTPVVINAPPLCHGTGFWVGAIRPLCGGSTVVLLSTGSYSGEEFARVIEQEHGTFLVIVGDAMAKPLLRALDEARGQCSPLDMSSVKVVQSGGVMWTAAVKRGLLEHMPQAELVDIMGATEGSMAMQTTRQGDPVETAEFVLVPSARILSEDGDELPPGEVGLLAVLEPQPPLGYYKDPEATARTFRVINGQRYTVPGDWAKVDESGRVVLLGRGSGCINTGGEKVFPEEVEEAIKSVPGVEDSLVVGMPDDRFGERVAAVVSVRRPVTEDEIMWSCRQLLAGYKCPRSITFVSEVPRFENGKADYPTARRLATSPALTTDPSRT